MPTFLCVLILMVAAAALNPDNAVAQSDEPPDPIRRIVERLDLEKYKATIKGLTQFGDRQQGTDRNRAAVDWIESQLKSFGCTNIERIHYDYQPPATPRRRPARGPREGEGGSVMFGNRVPHQRQQGSGEAAGCAAPRAQCAAVDARPARGGFLYEDRLSPS